LDGDIDKALKYTHAFYEAVLQDNPHIYFQLRCRKFLEMLRRSSELSSNSSRQNKSSNGAALLHDDDDVFEQEEEMELDDQIHDTYSDTDGMETEEPESTHELLTEAVQYGQQLRADCPSDDHGDDRKFLEDIFSLVAYADPKSSVHGHYLDPAGRIAVAEELNSAILGEHKAFLLLFFLLRRAWWSGSKDYGGSLLSYICSLFLFSISKIISKYLFLLIYKNIYLGFVFSVFKV
jgi:Ran-binding protein 9/10